LLVPRYLSDVREPRRKAKGRIEHSAPSEICTWDFFMREEALRCCIKESNQDSQIAFPFPLHLIVFSLFNHRVCILTALKLTENISTNESLNYFLVLPQNITKVTS
jgi:hypothetical protein